MPFPTTCSRQPCPNHVLRNGLCAEHLSQRDRARGTTQERGYGTDWEKVRAYKLSIDPFCELRIVCMGNLAKEVDHQIPISARPDLRLVYSNLNSACVPCHKIKTKRDIARRAGQPTPTSIPLP